VSAREAKRLAWSGRDGLFDDFVVELHDGFAQNIQHGGAAFREVIVPAAAFALSGSGLRSQPTVALQTFQEGVERAGTDVVAVAAQLSQDPLTDDGMFGRMMKDVDLPEA
jgi:hypothetical protein